MSNTDALADQDGVHTMEAAVRAADGRMLAGVNPYHCTGGPCAELVALSAAREGGARQITTIVASASTARAWSGRVDGTARPSSTTTRSCVFSYP